MGMGRARSRADAWAGALEGLSLGEEASSFLPCATCDKQLRKRMQACLQAMVYMAYTHCLSPSFFPAPSVCHLAWCPQARQASETAVCAPGAKYREFSQSKFYSCKFLASEHGVPLYIALTKQVLM